MKKLLLIFAIWLSVSASAQKIHFTDTTNVWEQFISDYNDMVPSYHYYTFHFLRDTTINTYRYRMFNFGYPEVYYSLSLVREDTILKKVYIRDVFHDTDLVLLDYNLNVGDTLATYDTELHYYHKHVVSSIDSTLINGVWHKVWHLPFPADPHGAYLDMYIIEGVGCIQHPAYMFHRGGIEPPDERIYCFSNQGTIPVVSPPVWFFNNTTSCTHYPHLSASELLRVNTTKIYPNPSFTNITITSPNKITTLTITTLLGQTIYTHDHNSEKVEVDVSHYPPGIYLIRINGSEIRKFIKE